MSTRRSVSGWMVVALIVGMLAIVGIKEARESGWSNAILDFGPNLVAGLTMPCFFLAKSVKGWRGNPHEVYPWSRLWRDRKVIGMAWFWSTAGLLAWEFIQPYRPNRTFDWQDVWATLAGSAAFLVAVVVARWITTGSAYATSCDAEHAPAALEQSP